MAFYNQNFDCQTLPQQNQNQPDMNVLYPQAQRPVREMTTVDGHKVLVYDEPPQNWRLELGKPPKFSTTFLIFFSVS